MNRFFFVMRGVCEDILTHTYNVYLARKYSSKQDRLKRNDNVFLSNFLVIIFQFSDKMLGILHKIVDKLPEFHVLLFLFKYFRVSQSSSRTNMVSVS